MTFLLHFLPFVFCFLFSVLRISVLRFSPQAKGAGLVFQLHCFPDHSWRGFRPFPRGDGHCATLATFDIALLSGLPTLMTFHIMCLSGLPTLMTFHFGHSSGAMGPWRRSILRFCQGCRPWRLSISGIHQGRWDPGNVRYYAFVRGADPGNVRF